MSRVLGVIIAVVVGLLFVEIFSTNLDSSITDPTTQSGAVLSAADGSGTLALTDQNFYTDRTNLSVTGTIDGALNNASTTIDADRNGITWLAGALTVSTSQTMTITHDTENTTDRAVPVLKIIPFLFVIGVMGATVFGAFTGVQTGRGGRGGSSLNIQGFIVVLIGVILVEVITTFVDSADAAYTVRPEYVGVTAVLPLVTIGYVLSLISMVVGTGVARVKGGL